MVVGAGYIGLEVAESLLARGLKVTEMGRLDAPLGAVLDADMAAFVAETMRAAGVDLQLGTAVTGLAVTNGHVSAVQTAAGSVAADLVLIGLGVRANVELARAAGIEVGEAGGIVVDDRQRTSLPHVWAAGDCVESRHRVTGRAVVVALGTHANKQGRFAGTNIAGGEARFGGVLGTAITKFQDLEIARTGLTEREAKAAGLDAFSVITEAPSRAHYYPGGQSMRIKIVAERQTGRLPGAQIVGGQGAGKRIDVLATALWNEMSLDEVGGMDLRMATKTATRTATGSARRTSPVADTREGVITARDIDAGTSRARATKQDVWLTDPGARAQGRFTIRCTPADARVCMYRCTQSDGARTAAARPVVRQAKAALRRVAPQQKPHALAPAVRGD